MLETNPKPENLRINGRFDKDGAIGLLTHHIVGSINNAFSSNMSIQWTIPTGILSDVFSLSILEYVTSLIWRRTKHDRDRERRVMTKTNTLSPIEDAIVCTSNSICENIAALSDKPKLLSQNILQYVRNLVEYTSQRVFPWGEESNPNDYEQKKKAYKYLENNCSDKKLQFLGQFHRLLQKSVSHYTIDGDGSERLMLKYYTYLLKLRALLHEKYGLDILQNLEDMPIPEDDSTIRYHDLVAKVINEFSAAADMGEMNDLIRVYVQKIRPFVVEGKIFYEITYSLAHDNTSKYDRQIAFTEIEMTDNYAAKIHILPASIEIFGTEIPIQIIDHWEVAIRPCEASLFTSVFGDKVSVNTNSSEFKALMAYLTRTKNSLLNLVTAPADQYNLVKQKCTIHAEKTPLFAALDQARKLLAVKGRGSNVIRYFLHKMNNKMMKPQYNPDECKALSGLHLQYGCIPFDTMPFATSLIRHNPRIGDLLECIDSTDHDHEFLGRAIRNQSEQNSMLFIPEEELNCFEDVDGLAQTYNSKVYGKHSQRHLHKYRGHWYIGENLDNTVSIMKTLDSLAASGDENRKDIDIWLNNNPDYGIGSDEQLNCLRTLFTKSKVALIYGAAGTGKTKFLEHISHLYSENRRLYLATTHTAVENLHRRIGDSNATFKTIASFLYDRTADVQYDIVFIDECSMVSTRDMREILDKAIFDKLVLAGDVFQIEAIRFGNWFLMAQGYLRPHTRMELKENHRNNDRFGLALMWDRVRNSEDSILEVCIKNKMVASLEEFAFNSLTRDEIILCLNYDGFFGINNINRIMQNHNTNSAVQWGTSTYKVGDPILFNEVGRFDNVIYNNMKGRIVSIEPEDEKIWFTIELDTLVPDPGHFGDYILIKDTNDGHSIIRFDVDKYDSVRDDDADMRSLVPFQVAYAVSIHKAQGLEYDSVKLVISGDFKRNLTQNIFYTAITRCREHLMLYWNAATEQNILDQFGKSEKTKDLRLLKQYVKEQLTSRRP